MERWRSSVSCSRLQISAWLIKLIIYPSRILLTTTCSSEQHPSRSPRHGMTFSAGFPRASSLSLLSHPFLRPANPSSAGYSRPIQIGDLAPSRRWRTRGLLTLLTRAEHDRSSDSFLSLGQSPPRTRATRRRVVVSVLPRTIKLHLEMQLFLPSFSKAALGFRLTMLRDLW